MAEQTGKQYAENMKNARDYANDLGAILQNQVAGAAKSTQQAAADMANSLKGQVSAADKLSTLTQQRNEYIDAQVAAGKFINQGLIKQLDTQIKLLAQQKKQDEVQDAIKAKQEEFQQSIDDAKDKAQGLQNTFMAIVTDPMTALTAGLVALVALIGAFAKAAFQTTKELGLSAGQGLKLAGATKEAAIQAKMYGGSTEDAMAAAAALTKEAGALENLNSEAVMQVTELSVRYGLSADNAAKLNTVFKDVTDGTQQGAESMQDMVTSLAKANNVAPGAVLEDIANNTEAFARFGAEGAKEFVMTSIAAKKLGIEMSSITSAADALLDIEGSIAKQMEAEVLLGRQLNLDAARQAALQGDYLTLTKELANQVGSVAEFNSMNAIQQQALADSLGMSVADTRKMVENQDKLAGLSDEALQHYKETGEIQGEGESLLNAQNIQLAMQATTAAAALVSLGSQLGLRTSIFGMAKATADVDKGAGGGGAAGGGIMESIGKIDMGKVLKGAAAMVIVAAAVVVFAFAVQQFMQVSWEAVGMAIVSMLALVGAVALLGAIMMSGVGAVAIIAGAAAMLIVAAAMLVLAYGLKIISEAIPNFMLLIPMLPELAVGMMMMYPAIPAFYLLGLAMIPFGIGLAAMSVGLLIFSALGGTEILMGMAESIGLLAPSLIPFAAGIAALGMVSPLMALIGLAMIPLGFGLWWVSGYFEDFREAIGDGSAFKNLGESIAMIGPYAPVMSGLGYALGSFGSGLALLGAGALIASVGLGLMAAVGGPATIASLASSLTMLAPFAEQISALGNAFLNLSLGIVSLAGSLLLLTPMIPTMLVFGHTFSPDGLLSEAMLGGGGGGDEGDDGQSALVEKLDELISVVKQGGTVTLDGKKVGDVLTLAGTPLGA